MRTSQRRRWLIPLVVLLGLVCTLGNAFVVAEPAGAATMLFVSASGTDTNPCSSTAPCATITHVLSLAASGDTIEVAGHIFDSVTVTTTITIEQWPGQAPAVVDASLQPNHSVFFNSSGNLTLDGLTVTGGSSLTGAGIDTFGAETTTVNDSTITGNTATVPPMSPGGGAIGGGIDIRDSGNFIITDSTISGNTAEGDTQTNFPGMGRGGRGGGIDNLANLTITNSTIAGNTAAAGSAFGGEGGGVENDDGTLTITDSTVSENTATGPGASGGGISTFASTAIAATIAAGNTATGTTNNCSGSMTSVGYNLTDDATGTACGFTQPTDKVNASPDLGPLANNGGPTETLLPTPSSPALGVIPSPTTLNGVPVCGAGAFDQRGWRGRRRGRTARSVRSRLRRARRPASPVLTAPPLRLAPTAPSR